MSGAKELENHISETIPFRYTQCVEGMRQILWETNQIISKENLDDKTKIQCLTLLSNVYRAIADMTADGAIVEQAIKKVKQIQLQQFRTQVESHEQMAAELLKEEEDEQVKAEAETQEQSQTEEDQEEDQEEENEEND